jgi:hypothetical protein
MSRGPELAIIEAMPERYDPWLSFIRLGPAAIHMARMMREMAVHHSGIKVGAVVLADSIEKQKIGLFGGANRNLRKGSNNTKVCAEELALTHTLNRKFDKVHAIFVSGPPQPDTQSQVVSETLHSCGVDRDNYMELWEQGVMDKETKVVTVHPEEDILEVYSMFDLQNIHHHRATDKLQAYYDYGFVKWRNGERYYTQRVESELLAGREPNRPRIAHEAVIGHWAVAA